MSELTYDFSQKNFVVIGASSGMGKKIACELAEAGAKVLAIARNEAALVELERKYHGKLVAKVCDVCDYDEMNEKLGEYIKEHGKVNGAVYTAGIDGLTPLKAFDTHTAKKIMETSLWGAVNALQFLVKKKNSQDGASFVLFSSVFAKTGAKGMFAYSAAKAAVSATVKSFAKEIDGRTMRINAICPGRVATPMTENYSNEEVVKRHLLGEGIPDDVSGAVLFLLSDRAKWITGTDIVIDGGYLIN